MKNKDVSFWLFLAPILITLFAVVIYPFGYGIFYSFTDWNGLSATEFVGLKNYIDVISQSDFRESLWVTIKIAFYSIILINIIGLGLALVVNSKIRTSNFLRTIFFMPNLIGGLILGFIWQFIFVSVFRDIGVKFGLEFFLGWLSTPSTAMWGIIILNTWQWAGYIMIIYLAYLQSIPGELLEAADIDGAGPLQKLKNIIIPLLAPAFTVSIFLTLSHTFKMYDQNLSLTNGGPYGSTEMLAMDIYNTAYIENNVALGQSKAVVFFVIVSTIGVLQVYVNKKREVDL